MKTRPTVTTKTTKKRGKLNPVKLAGKPEGWENMSEISQRFTRFYQKARQIGYSHAEIADVLNLCKTWVYSLKNGARLGKKSAARIGITIQSFGTSASVVNGTRPEPEQAETPPPQSKPKR